MTSTYSLRSWWAIAGIGLIAALTASGLASDAWPFAALTLLVCAWLLVQSLAGQLVVDRDGVRRRPGRLHLAWSEIERFEAKPRPDLVRTIKVHRRRGRPVTLTVPSIKPALGARLLAELESRLSASRTG